MVAGMLAGKHLCKLRVRSKDRVIVISGRDKGKIGEVLKVLPEKRRAVVRGVNIVKRHRKPSASQQGGIVDQEISIDISNLAQLDPRSNRPTRVGYRLLEDGRKVRFAKRSGELIDF